MSENEALIKALAEAIKAEIEGQHFYLMAARTTSDEAGKGVFEQLAAEEVEHQRFLKAQHAALSESGRPDATLKLGPRPSLSGESPIFSPALKARAKEAHFEMTALAIGVQLEQNAIVFYEQQAAAASDPTVKGFFEELAEWERGHYEALLRQQEHLKEDYWSDAGFSPF